MNEMLALQEENSRLRERVGELQQFHDWALPQIERVPELEKGYLKREHLLMEAVGWLYRLSERRLDAKHTAPPAHLAPLIAEATKEPSNV
jgi:hypothetical protein